MYPSIFNRFPVIQPVISKVHFSTFFAYFGLPWVRPWDSCGKCYMDRKRIQCWSNASQHVPIYLQPFPSNSTRKFKSQTFAILAHFTQFGPGTIEVNITWIEREFNAGQMFSSIIYPSIFNSLRAIARYWSEIATFSYPLAFGGVPIGIPGTIWSSYN